MAIDVLGFPLRWPIIAAPMAGGPSTPALVAAVSGAGGLGFVAGGYRTVEGLSDEIARVRSLTRAPFGVNLFVPSNPTADRNAVARYLATLQPEADHFEIPIVASWDDDAWPAKLELVGRLAVPVVSFTFGCPPPSVVADLHRSGSRVVINVTTAEEASLAKTSGADAVGAQGIEAGGHQSTFSDETALDAGMGLSALLAAILRVVDIPVIAAGGLMTGADVARIINAGAAAAQLGTAFLRTPESGAHRIHKSALVDPSFEGTAITRSFSGRRARGLVNRFMRDHPNAPPSSYPEINNATRALRSEAVRRGDPQAINLWAGVGHARAEDLPAAEVIERIGSEYNRLTGLSV